MKKILAMILVSVMVLGLCACGSSAPAVSTETTNAATTESKDPAPAAAATAAPAEPEQAKEPTYHWQMATTDYTGKPLVNAMNRFAAAVYEKTNGDIVIDVVGARMVGALR